MLLLPISTTCMLSLPSYVTIMFSRPLVSRTSIKEKKKQNKTTKTRRQTYIFQLSCLLEGLKG